MKAEDYLKKLNEHDKIFDSSNDYDYTEDQLLDFAERYAQQRVNEVLDKIINDFEERKKEAPTFRDAIYLDGVLAILQDYKKS